MSRARLLEIYLDKRAVCTDTRKIVQGSIFFALKGDSFDGNQYAKKALESGCSWAIVDDGQLKDHPSMIHVNDTLVALQDLAKDYRNTLSIPILSITGSNGKTTTKELIRDILRRKYKVFATHGNLNNHIGVPLSILSIQARDEIAIIEMGANHQKEIEFLCEIAQPDLGMITNIGKAHLEGFGGPEGVKKGKGELFDFLRKKNRKVFVNEQLNHLMELSEGLDRIVYQSEGGKYNIEVVQNTPTLSFQWTLNGKTIRVDTHFTGLYNIHNMSSAIVVGDYFNVPMDEISEAIASYEPDNNRSQIEKTANNTVIMDAYNANPTSTEHALKNLAAMDSANRYFVLGDMLEMGSYGKEEHDKIIQLTQELELKGIFVGPQFLSSLQNKALGFDTTESAANYLKGLQLKDHTILIKGSRGMKLEVLLKLF